MPLLKPGFLQTLLADCLLHLSLRNNCVALSGAAAFGALYEHSLRFFLLYAIHTIDQMWPGFIEM